MKESLQKVKMSRNELALGLLCSFVFIICLIILMFPNIREMLFSDPEGLMPFNKVRFLLPAAGIIFSVLVVIFMFFEKSVIAAVKKNIILLSFSAVTLAAIAIRLPGMQFSSGDYQMFIEPWTSFLAANNHLFGINTINTNYTPFYLYILGFISFLPESLWLIGVKLVSCLFDFLLAVVCGKIILSITGRKERALVAYSAILLCPIVFMNSSIWAQCDSIYVSFMFLSLLLFIKGKNNSALFIYGIVLTIKLQSIFMLPFIIILYLHNKYKIGNIVFLFLGFLTTPIIGLPFGAPKRLLKSFIMQISLNNETLTPLSVNAPSVYALFHVSNESVPMMQTIGMIFTLGVLVCFALYLLYNNSKYASSPQDTGYSNVPFEGRRYVVIFFFFTLILPFLLPKMCDRYFLAAGVASIVFAVLYPGRWWITLLIVMPVCATYFNYLFDNTANLLSLAIIMLVAVLLVTRWTIDSIRDHS